MDGDYGVSNEFINESREVIVIQYLETKMSEKLLCKFPDNSAFDFDYSQSALWSPLLSRRYNASLLKRTPLKRKLMYDDEEVEENWKLFKKITFSKIKRKILTSINFNFNLPKKRLKFDNYKVGAVDSSPLCPKSTRKKQQGWEKCLRMKSKQLKKTKKDQNTKRMTLSDYLQFDNL